MRVGRCFAYCVGAQALLAAPALIWPGYLDTPVGVVLMLPFLSIYAAHALGIPGLLENQGACGWGWCAPSVFGRRGEEEAADMAERRGGDASVESGEDSRLCRGRGPSIARRVRAASTRPNR